MGTGAHEVGHALGAGHANATNGAYLMEPVLNEILAPTSCDVNAVEAAQNWYLTAPSGGPALPPSDHVHCWRTGSEPQRHRPKRRSPPQPAGFSLPAPGCSRRAVIAFGGVFLLLRPRREQ